MWRLVALPLGLGDESAGSLRSGAVRQPVALPLQPHTSLDSPALAVTSGSRAFVLAQAGSDASPGQRLRMLEPSPLVQGPAAVAQMELQPPDHKRDLWFQCSWCCCLWRLQGSEIFCCCLTQTGTGTGSVTWTLMLTWSPSWVCHEGWQELVLGLHLSV